MFLNKIVLKNFRQFYGEQEIEFSADRKKNVTLLHAENGVGKTTLLNSLLWCFYKITTAKFEDPHKIVSHQALSEDVYEASVEIFFEQNNQKYFVRRMVDEQLGTEEFEAYSINSGNLEKLPSPNLFVESVIPREMSKYFFFDGEYAETFSSHDNSKAVKSAIESMLGCNIAIQALKDIKALGRILDKKIGGLTKNNAAEAYQKQIERLNTENDKDRAALFELGESLDESRDLKKELQEQLKNSDGAGKIEENRERLRSELENLKSEANRIATRETAWLEQESIGLFSERVRKNCLDVIKDANIKGHIPSKIADTFVKDILSSKLCICNRKFEEGSVYEKAIKGLIKEAGTAIMSDRLMSVRGLLGNLDKVEQASKSIYQEISYDKKTLVSRRNEVELSLKECDQLLRGSKIKEIAKRQSALENVEEDIEKYLEKIARLNQSCDSREEKLTELRSKRNKFLQNNDQAEKLQKQSKLLTLTKDELTAELDKYRERSRKLIAKKVNKILVTTARRDYTAEISDAFKLKMYYTGTDITVPKSSGENQLLSLVFIASLVEFSFERQKENDELLKPGTMAPLMLDSPFGKLDPTYRKSTADFLPNLSGQVILLLSKSQGDSEVLAALKPRIGQEYVLVSEVKSGQGDKPKDIITLDGKEFAASVYNAEKTKTTIHKVR